MRKTVSTILENMEISIQIWTKLFLVHFFVYGNYQNES